MTDSATEAVHLWLHTFAAALDRGDAAAASALFEDPGYWRDLLAFTWNIKTLEGPAAIRAMLDAQLAPVRPRNWQVQGAASQADGITEAWLSFSTAAGSGLGHLRLRNGRCWTLLTSLQALAGHEERAGSRREKGTEHGVVRGRRSWLDRRQQEQSELGITRQPYVLIVGGGQGALALAARLRRLQVPTLIVEKNARPGDSWRRRYKSLCLHDPVWFDHLPYLPFPDHWPVYTPKDKMGDWLEMYARVMELDYWGSTECRAAHFDPGTGTWTVEVLREGRTMTLHPTQLVLATGVSGFPRVPQIPGAEQFAGTQHHSSAHPGGDGWAGKHCIVLGANNSAHDIAADLWEHGAQVTMIQRSSTLVARSETLNELALAPLYSEEALQRGITTEKADLILASIPYALLGPMQVPLYEAIQQRDAAFYARLRAAGFQLDFGEDGSGLILKYLRRGSGYYIDVGASELIASGDVALRSGTGIARIQPRSVVLGTGEELPADLLVYATGYGPMNEWAARLISPEVAERVGRCWGLGSGTTHDPGPWEGELRNLWKPTAQPQLWFQGGNLQQARHYSLVLALQLKARFEGIATPVYGLPPVHHRA